MIGIAADTCIWIVLEMEFAIVPFCFYIICYSPNCV